jgi:Flp pilus assembly protein TadD
MSAALTNLEKLLAAGKDGALLRFGLGGEYLKAGDFGMAAGHLQRALALDPDYSAAYKLLGRALEGLGQFAEARRTYIKGAEVAEARGDKQASKEMTVFARRLERRGV